MKVASRLKALRSRNDLGLLLGTTADLDSLSYALRIRGHDGIHSHGRISRNGGPGLGEVRQGLVTG